MTNKVLIAICSFCLSLHSQITQLYTGTNVTINHLSCIGNTVLIGGLSGNFLAKSYNEGTNLISLSCPGTAVNNKFVQRLNKDTVFLLSIGNEGELYRSTDGGNNWTQRMDTTIFIPNSSVFFNGYEGIMDNGNGNQILRTYNSGSAWTTTTSPVYSFLRFKTYGDSIVIGSGVGFNGFGSIFLSKDRGHSWPYTFGIPIAPTDFCFLNNDTIFVISGTGIWGSSFIRSTNAGQSWQTFSAPLFYNDGMAKNGKEIYVVGSDNQNMGVISKSFDFGQTWSKFNTGINCRLSNLIFLNDSIALLSGTNGVLLRWNYTNTVFTGVKENEKLNSEIILFPNPVKDKLSFKFSNGASENLKLTITNTLGQLVYLKEIFDLKETLDVSFLKKGIYYLELEGNKYYRVFKVVKE